MRSTGESYFVGHFSGPLDLGAGTLPAADSEEAFLLKVDSGNSFSAVWAESYIGMSRQNLSDVAITTAGHPTVVGYYEEFTALGGPNLPTAANGDAKVMVGKLDHTNAAHIWSHGFGLSGRSSARGVATDASDQVAVVGAFGGIIDWGAATNMTATNDSDGFVVMLSP
jgi:hypothetical protein